MKQEANGCMRRHPRRKEADPTLQKNEINLNLNFLLVVCRRPRELRSLWLGT